MKKLTFLLSVVFALTGCGLNQMSDNGKSTQDYNGTHLMTNREPIQEPKDIDYSTQNPNVDITNSPLYRGEDQDQVNHVLALEKGYWLGSMWTNGKDAWVTVYTSNELTKKELKKKEQMLHEKLQAALPRFDLRVKLKKEK